MGNAFIAVDLGAQSGRVMLGTFTDDGFTLEQLHRFANSPITIDGVLCWDAERLFDQTLEGIALAVRAASDSGDDVRGIAVDSWGVDYGLVSSSGELVAPVRHYRATDMATMQVAAKRAPFDVAYSRTGIIESPINTCYQLVRDQHLGLLHDDITALLIPDLWTFWLTGARGAERTIASTTGLLDRTTGDWSTALLSELGLEAHALAPLVDSGTLAGDTSAEITERIGADAPIPVWHVPGHDTACAFAAVTDAGRAHAVISCGTWALVGVVTTQPVLSEHARALGFTNEEGAQGAITLIRNLSGTWLLEECVREWSAQFAEPTNELRTRLLTAAATITDDQLAGLIDVGSTTLLEPGDMPARISSLYAQSTGDTQPLTPAATVRLIIESLAGAFAATITAAGELTGQPVNGIHMIGGGANIELLIDRTRAVTGLPVTVGHSEATSIGNICVQAVASGMIPSLDDARDATREGR